MSAPRACPLCGYVPGPSDAFCSLCGASMHAVPGAQGQAAAVPRPRGFLVLSSGARLEVGEAPLVVGRAQLQGVVGTEALGRISRAHFCIARQGDGFVLQDGGTPAQAKPSLNGTWVGGPDGAPKVRAIEGTPVQLRGGASIDIARAATARFEVVGG